MNEFSCVIGFTSISFKTFCDEVGGRDIIIMKHITYIMSVKPIKINKFNFSIISSSKYFPILFFMYLFNKNNNIYKNS